MAADFLMGRKDGIKIHLQAENQEITAPPCNSIYLIDQ